MGDEGFLEKPEYLVKIDCIEIDISNPKIEIFDQKYAAIDDGLDFINNRLNSGENSRYRDDLELQELLSRINLFAMDSAYSRTLEFEVQPYCAKLTSKILNLARRIHEDGSKFLLPYLRGYLSFISANSPEHKKVDDEIDELELATLFSKMEKSKKEYLFRKQFVKILLQETEYLEEIGYLLEPGNYHAENESVTFSKPPVMTPWWKRPFAKTGFSGSINFVLYPTCAEYIAGADHSALRIRFSGYNPSVNFELGQYRAYKVLQRELKVSDYAQYGVIAHSQFREELALELRVARDFFKDELIEVLLGRKTINIPVMDPRFPESW
jgi:hypothetical protein